MTFAMFRLEDGALVPNPVARSLWSPDQMHGVAVSGALARALESALAEIGRDDLVPVRYTLDLFRPALMEPSTTSTVVVREGRRIALVDAMMHQGDDVVARASCTFLKPSESPDGDVWTADQHPEPPPLDVSPASEEPRVPFFLSDAPWSQTFQDHQNAGRKQTWQVGIPVVEGEDGSPFQSVAAVADATSMVVNWGTEGVKFINTDVTLSLSRPPVSKEVGLSATNRVEHDGISVGTVEVYDRRGPLGTAMVTGLANARRPVDFETLEFEDDGGTRTTRTP